jgi:putative phosphonate metabolism protein
MSNFPRYAIYYLPAADSALARFGAAMLGYDAVSGDDVPFAAATKAVVDWREVTEDPRSYGFHATLKAPFALADGGRESKLLWACASFAETPRKIPQIVPTIRPIGRFIALVPDAPSDALAQLAADCVRDFDGFRAPLSVADRARRKPERLTPQQVDHLDRWGYPYVMEEFRFHMTLTGSLDPARHDKLLKLLREQFAATGIGAIAVDRIAVLRQDELGARFKSIAQFELRSADY